MSKVIKRSHAHAAVAGGGWAALPAVPASRRPSHADGPDVGEVAAAATAAARDDAHRQACDEGFRHGYEEGKAMAAEAMRQAEEAMRTVTAEREGLAARIEAERMRMMEDLREDVARLAMDVARQVLQRELSARPEEVADLVRRMLHQAQDQEEITVLVHPAEAAALEAQREDLLAGLRATQRVEIVPDPGIEAGGAVLETLGGTWDARLSTRIEAVERELRGALGLDGGEEDSE